MNYRHEYHAGNFADVFKHIMLTRMIEYFKRKDKAFRYIDTHAGSGSYVLPEYVQNPDDPKQQVPEWLNGVARLKNWQPSEKIANLVEPYLSIVLGEKGLPNYPGSPVLARQLMRKQDRLSACELHPEEFDNLKANFQGDYQARIMELDGWLVAGSQLPPKENRGLVLIDPPFELPAEFNRLIDSLEKCAKRWAGGTMACWYPLKHDGDVRLFKSLLKESGISNLFIFEMMIDRPTTPPKLYGNGMIVRNPPYILGQDMAAILKELTPVLETSKGTGSWKIERLTDE